MWRLLLFYPFILPMGIFSWWFLISILPGVPALLFFGAFKHAIPSTWSTVHSFPLEYLALIIHPSDLGLSIIAPFLGASQSHLGFPVLA